jgi:hypothetical protein
MWCSSRLGGGAALYLDETVLDETVLDETVSH